MDKHTMWLPVKLTTDEMAAKGLDLAKVDREREELDQERAAFMEEVKTKRKGIDTRAFQLGCMIRRGAEDRQVEIEERPDYGRRVADIYRLDTGEFVEQRALTEDEMQMPLIRGVSPLRGKRKASGGDTDESTP